MFTLLRWLLVPLKVRQVESDSTPELLCRFCAMTLSRPEARELVVGKGCTCIRITEPYK